MEATQMPNNKLEQQNKKPTASTGFSFIYDEKFLSIKSVEAIYILI